MTKKNILASVTWENNGIKKQLAGFIVIENKTELVISPTFGIKGFLDKVIIPKKEIIERKDLIC